MAKKEVVTAFIEHGGKVLVLQRSQKVSTYQGRWAGVSGSVENSPHEQALKEIGEETGLGQKDVRLARCGEPLEIVDEEKGITWVVHPFLFHTDMPEKIRIDWEHVKMRWIDPEELGHLETVPGLVQTLERVWNPKDT